jgi:hypothetical protein
MSGSDGLGLLLVLLVIVVLIFGVNKIPQLGKGLERRNWRFLPRPKRWTYELVEGGKDRQKEIHYITLIYRPRFPHFPHSPRNRNNLSFREAGAMRN